MAKCPTCGRCEGGETYEVTCVVCKETRWPVLPEPPVKYTCVRCRMRPRERKVLTPEHKAKLLAARRRRVPPQA